LSALSTLLAALTAALLSALTRLLGLLTAALLTTLTALLAALVALLVLLVLVAALILICHFLALPTGNGMFPPKINANWPRVFPGP
jgi:hypothetical protein